MTTIPGLNDKNNKIVEDILQKYLQQSPFVLFGSRAKGNYRLGSDIDIAVKGSCERSDLMRIKEDFDDSLLPYFVDVVVYDRIKNPELREHIDRVGIVLTK